MSDAIRLGYLNENFRFFHITDINRKTFEYHYHDFHKILFLVEGNVSYNIEGNVYDLKPFDLVLVNHGEIHMPVIEMNCTYERYILYISPDYLSEFTKESYDLQKCFSIAKENQSHVIRLSNVMKNTLLSKMLHLEKVFQDSGYAHEILEENAFLDLLVFLNRATLEEHFSFINQPLHSFKMAPVLAFINSHLTEDLSIERLSNEFFLSRSYLMHTFKEETGYTINQYTTNKRLFLARELILSGTTITDACYQCGFQNYSTFSRAYKKIFDEAPRKMKGETE